MYLLDHAWHGLNSQADSASEAHGICGGCEERARGDDARAVCENGTASDLECASEEMNSL